ncbi:hypothetical protein RB601_008074 [Gaeumannomyces tritici]
MTLVPRSSSSSARYSGRKRQRMRAKPTAQPPSPSFSEKPSKVDKSQGADASEAEDEELDVVWQAVRRECGSTESIILAVVTSEKTKPVSQMIRQKQANGEIKAKVVVTTPESLQNVITSTLTKSYNKLFLLAAPAVDTITYKVSSVVSSVHVAPCQPTTRGDVLRIGSRSTYCGERAYAWHMRSEKLSRYKIEHAEGCFFELSDDLDEAVRLVDMPGSAPDLTDAELADIKSMLVELHHNNDNAASPTAADTPVSTPPSSTPTPGRRWWDEWKRVVVACVCGAAGAVSAAGAFIWFSAGGVFLKGPMGFEVAVRWLSMGGAVGGCAVAAGVGLAAGGMVYFVPWEKVLAGLKRLLRRVWETIKGAVSWVRRKIEEMMCAARSAAVRVVPSARTRRMKTG